MPPPQPQEQPPPPASSPGPRPPEVSQLGPASEPPADYLDDALPTPPDKPIPDPLPVQTSAPNSPLPGDLPQTLDSPLSSPLPAGLPQTLGSPLSSVPPSPGRHSPPPPPPQGTGNIRPRRTALNQINYKETPASHPMRKRIAPKGKAVLDVSHFDESTFLPPVHTLSQLDPAINPRSPEFTAATDVLGARLPRFYHEKNKKQWDSITSHQAEFIVRMDYTDFVGGSSRERQEQLSTSIVYAHSAPAHVLPTSVMEHIGATRAVQVQGKRSAVLSVRAHSPPQTRRSNRAP
jgi:hypothetical protein